MVYSGELPLPRSSMSSYRTVDSPGPWFCPAPGSIRNHVVRHLVAATVVDDSDLLEVVAVEPKPPAAGLVANHPAAKPAQLTPELAAENADVEQLGPALGVAEGHRRGGQRPQREDEITGAPTRDGRP